MSMCSPVWKPWPIRTHILDTGDPHWIHILDQATPMERQWNKARFPSKFIINFSETESSQGLTVIPLCSTNEKRATNCAFNEVFFTRNHLNLCQKLNRTHSEHSSVLVASHFWKIQFLMHFDNLRNFPRIRMRVSQNWSCQRDYVMRDHNTQYKLHWKAPNFSFEGVEQCYDKHLRGGVAHLSLIKERGGRVRDGWRPCVSAAEEEELWWWSGCRLRAGGEM